MKSNDNILEWPHHDIYYSCFGFWTKPPVPKSQCHRCVSSWRYWDWIVKIGQCHEFQWILHTTISSDSLKISLAFSSSFISQTNSIRLLFISPNNFFIASMLSSAEDYRIGFIFCTFSFYFLLLFYSLRF